MSLLIHWFGTTPVELGAFPSPSGRRWREATDEGETARAPGKHSLIRLRHLLPEGEGKMEGKMQIGDDDEESIELKLRAC
jgi:hypothetical protein